MSLERAKIAFLNNCVSLRRYLYQLFNLLKKDNLKIDQVLDCVAKYLFISDKWKKMNPLVLERQALDLVKLVFQMNSLLLQNFIQSAENSSDIFFQTMPLHVRLLLSRWRLDLKALSFLKSAVSDCRRAA